MVTKNLFSLAAMSAKCLCLVAALATAFSLASCGDDDDDGYDVSATIIEAEDGDKLQVTRAGSIYYGYDDDGYINYLDWDGEEFEGSDNATKFYCSDDEYELTVQLSYNGSGYISKATDKGGYYYDDGDYDSWEESASFSYDGSGHLTKISYSGKNTEVYDGDKESYSFSGTITLTWSDGLLTTYVHSEEDSDGDTEIETYEFDYNDGQYANAYNQHTPSSVGCGDDLLVFAFAFAGLCGKGPDYLPRTVEYSDYEAYDDEEYEYSGSTTYKYGFNSDGTVDYQCTSSGKSYKYFEYGNAVSYSVNKAPSLTAGTESLSTSKSRRIGLFGKVSKHQRAATAE